MAGGGIRTGSPSSELQGGWARQGPRQLPASLPPSPCLPDHVCRARLPAPLSCPPASREENKSRCLAGKQREEEAGGRRPPTAPGRWGMWVPHLLAPLWAQDPWVLRRHRERSGWQQEPSRQPCGAAPMPWSPPPTSHLPLGAGLRVWSLTMPAESL